LDQFKKKDAVEEEAASLEVENLQEEKKKPTRPGPVLYRRFLRLIHWSVRNAEAI
jgi:hypothetical protein